jgi:hypothetical protein
MLNHFLYTADLQGGHSAFAVVVHALEAATVRKRVS